MKLLHLACGSMFSCCHPCVSARSSSFVVSALPLPPCFLACGGLFRDQLLMSMTGDHPWVDFAVGGGKTNFYNSTEADAAGEFGSRVDGRNLVSEAADAGVMTAQTKDEFMALDMEDG